LILNGIKYKLLCTRKGQSSFKIELDTASTDAFVMTNIRLLSDGGFLIEIGGKSHVAYLTGKGDAANGMRLNIAGSTIVFSPDYDPTSLGVDVAGKLVKRLVPDGARVKKGEPYAEIEVMKMFLPLKVEEAGIVEWKANEGAALVPGELLAMFELDNTEKCYLFMMICKMKHGAIRLAHQTQRGRIRDWKTAFVGEIRVLEWCIVG
jgi:acetyl-CoA carboxylase / biotin carboxylase 1